MAEISSSFMESKLLMCTGKHNFSMHVDAVGLHLQPSLHPCTKQISIGSPRPSGGIVKEPVTNLSRSGSDRSTSSGPK